MKKIINLILFIIIISILLSCNGNKSESYARLEETDEKLSFPLDSDTKTSIYALFPYTDKTGKEYLTFQNERKNEILVYDMDSKTLLHKIKPEEEGSNGVGRFFGYYIFNFDSIYLTARRRANITCIDLACNVKERIKYETTSNNLPLGGSNSISSSYRPLIMIDNEMYIISKCNRQANANPVTATINMKTKEIKSLPFEYPIFEVSKNKSKPFSIEMNFSRIYDGVNFIYSFHYDEYIYITPPDHKSIKKIKANSKYISKIKFTENMHSGNPMKNECENPKYSNLFYDKYRNVYYRIAYPENEISPNENFKDIYAYGRKTFSIIILDKDFNSIGETLFPDYIYNPTLTFINKDGLYISCSHYKNPNYNEDSLDFIKLELVYNTK